MPITLPQLMGLVTPDPGISDYPAGAANMLRGQSNREQERSNKAGEGIAREQEAGRSKRTQWELENRLKLEDLRRQLMEWQERNKYLKERDQGAVTNPEQEKVRPNMQGEFLGVGKDSGVQPAPMVTTPPVGGVYAPGQVDPRLGF